MALNYLMMVERYPNLKEEVGGSKLGFEISSLLDKKTCQVVNYLLCFDVGMLTFCLQKFKKKTQERITNLSSNDFLTIRFESTFSRFRCFIFRTHLLRDFVNGQITNVITNWSSRGCLTIWLNIGTGPRKYIVRITPSLSSILGVQILQCCSLAN